MISCNYPITLELDDNGTLLITSRDLPIATYAERQDDVLHNARGAITAIQSGLIHYAQPVPDATPAQAGEIVVPLSGRTQQKIGLYSAMQSKCWSMVDLARAMKTDHKSVRRLLDPCYKSTQDHLDKATWALGMALEISFRPLPRAFDLEQVSS